jgi:hypothetical protein
MYGSKLRIVDMLYTLLTIRRRSLCSRSFVLLKLSGYLEDVLFCHMV